MTSLSFTRQILRRITISARHEFNGFEDIGLNNGSSTTSSPRNMQRKMPSSDHGEIFYIEVFCPDPELMPLRKASILGWSVDLGLKMPTHHHYSGVVTIIFSSATSSSPRP